MNNDEFDFEGKRINVKELEASVAEYLQTQAAPVASTTSGPEVYMASLLAKEPKDFKAAEIDYLQAECARALKARDRGDLI